MIGTLTGHKKMRAISPGHMSRCMWKINQAVHAWTPEVQLVVQSPDLRLYYYVAWIFVVVLQSEVLTLSSSRAICHSIPSTSLGGTHSQFSTSRIRHCWRKNISWKCFIRKHSSSYKLCIWHSFTIRSVHGSSWTIRWTYGKNILNWSEYKIIQNWTRLSLYQIWLNKINTWSFHRCINQYTFSNSRMYRGTNGSCCVQICMDNFSPFDCTACVHNMSCHFVGIVCSVANLYMPKFCARRTQTMNETRGKNFP